MARYGICPQCNLNYIDLDTQERCDICKKQAFRRQDELEELLIEEYESEETNSPFQQDETEHRDPYEAEHSEEEDDENAAWREFADLDEEEYIPDFVLEDEEEESEEDDEEETEKDDDFEYVSADEYYEYEEEDEDEEDDDDF